MEVLFPKDADLIKSAEKEAGIDKKLAGPSLSDEHSAQVIFLERSSYSMFRLHHRLIFVINETARH